MHHGVRLGLLLVILATALPVALTPPLSADVSATERGSVLVCFGGGGDGIYLEEWTTARLVEYETTTGRSVLRAHPITGTCTDPAGLWVGIGWVPSTAWLCSLNSEGRWYGPNFVDSVYQREDQIPPDPASGSCPYPGGAGAFLRPRTETERAASTAVHMTELEVNGDLRRLYAWMHPDSQAIVPFSAMAGWYRDVFVLDPPVSMNIDEVRLVEWTWGVTGKVYPSAAEVSYRQRFADGREESGKVRLVRDDGVWRWFFGRDRDFVEEQIERYGRD